MILSATLIQRSRLTRDCADCGRPIYDSALRIAFRDVDESGTPHVAACYYHPYIAEDEGRHACAPDVPLVRAALARRSRSTPSLTTDAAHGRGERNHNG